VLGPIQPRVQWILGQFRLQSSQDLAVTNCLRLVPRLKKE
jgi:hypothetical protein